VTTAELITIAVRDFKVAPGGQHRDGRNDGGRRFSATTRAVIGVEPFGPHSLGFFIIHTRVGRGALSNGSEQERFTCRLVFGNT